MMAVPSIAVLPVKILGREADNEVAALADDITRELWGTLRGFKLDLRRASPSNDLPSWKSLGKDLSARYVLWSGARREGAIIHINVNLIEAESAREVWAGSFDYRPSDSGAMQRTATRISRMLSTELLQVEVRRPLPAKPEAAHFTMLGRSLMNNERSATTNGEAIALFEKALAIDPEDFLALVNYARATADHILNLWAPPEERAERVAKAEAAVKLALRLDPNYAGAHAAHGGVLRVRGDHAQAIVAFKQALILNPNYANAQAELGRELIEFGLADETVAHVEKAIAISPTDFELYKWCYWAGLASLHVGDHAAALDWARRSYQANRAYDNTVRLMALAYAYAGEESEARAKMSEFLTLRQGFTLAKWQQANASPNSLVTEQRARMYEAMKRLGAPEGKVKATTRP
jgi:tetratricopeptide (TPR) repeat protein